MQEITKPELIRHDKLLTAVNHVASIFLGSEDLEVTQEEIEEALYLLSDTIDVNRSIFWRNKRCEDGVLYSTQIATWHKTPCESLSQTFPFNKVFNNLPQIHGDESMDIINVHIKDLPKDSISSEATAGMKSLLAIPIMHAGVFWGFITFEDFETERYFAKEEENIISSGGIMIATAIMRSEMAENLRQAKDEAQNNARAKSEFLARMSHEIRTPLNAVIGLTTLAKKANDPIKTKQYLYKIDDSSHQLLNIINDVLDMSKIESDKLEISFEELSITKLLNHVTNVTNVKMAEKHQTFTTELNNNGIDMIVSDELRLSQVLINLLNNAIKFTPDFGTIQLGINLEPKSGDKLDMKVYVKDSGIGISDEQQSKLFQSFEQADGSITRKFGGTGLGLAISKKIITLMDGDIWVESKLGEGATFKFEVEIGRAIESAKMEKTETNSEDKEYHWENKKILVVEDIEINCEIVMGLLEDTGIQIECAENGKIAFEKVKAGNRYDLILMDIQMPIMDGYEATRKIREIATPEILTLPIIAMTANAFKEDQENALNAGLNAHVSKPIELEALLNTLDQYLI